MVSLSAIVEDGITHHQNGHRPPQHEQVIHEQDYTRDSQTFEPPTFSGFSSSEATPRGSITAGKRSAPSSLRSYSVLHGTPAARTGPPASLTIDYTPNRHHESYFEESHESVDPKWRSRPPQTRPVLKAVDTEFRSALEYVDPEQQEAERETKEKRDKRRHSRLQGDGTWDMRRWFTESPKDEVPGGIKRSAPPSRRASGHDGTSSSAGPSRQQTDNQEPTFAQSNDATSTSTIPNIPFLRAPKRSSSQPQLRTSFAARASGLPGQKWGRLRSLLPHIASQGAQMSMPTSAVTPHTVNITDELISGGLAALMLQLWFDRDERDHRRVPIFLHRLRIRISDSLYPLSGHKAVFRIECEYANGAARWVIYRQLRDFLSLHTHYTVSNAYNRAQDNIPDFPRTSLPYFKFLNSQRVDDLSHNEFARIQRESLENYLLGLIRAVMFHPSSNRLSGFLEVSALSISLAQTGGAQYKAGFLRIEASSKGSGFGRKGVSWKDKRKTRWCAVRESYLIVVDEPGETTIWDVFLLDSDFKIERPTRYFRQGLNLLHPDAEQAVGDAKDKAAVQMLSVAHDARSRRSLVGTIRSGVSKVLHRHRASSLDGHPRASTTTRGRSNSIGSSHSSASSDEGPEHHTEPAMLDPSMNVNPLVDEQQGIRHAHEGSSNGNKKKKKAADVSKHVFYVENSQTRLKLYAKNERQMLQWIAAFEKIAATSHYVGSNRFDSFAPIRLNVAAQWLVDGRDYFWNLSRAISLAKDTIYIHDWWLSPELQMRRPGKQQYRLDHLLERKAKEGVKIFIILYLEVSSKTTPTDSNYAKQRLMGLHENILVQRSPSHFQTGTFYWAHHEKMCVIDETIAFMGGLDACFGRWDTPQHVLIDDDDSTHIWEGKDYSNPRVGDFYNLNKPEEEMYDRSKVHRMPWHDISMQMMGQPARDLARHFVQRWNWLLRIKNHSRVMPFLIPPSDFHPGELTKMGLTGTCELQICRSAGPWSLGTPQKIEHSIQTAYLKAIQMSDHFVYIENQFFISSTMIGDVKVENKIGDAIVERAIRAHREGTPWRCCIMIPLLPGFTFPVDHSDASAIRMILECQNRTLFRGPFSIYSRLRKEGIEPENYVTVFSLRNWGKLRGDILTTEQVYIHAKVCIVDDRLAIIGSANINERSQKGDRDSELAAIIRDTDMIEGSMAGKPYKVGRFAHTLRVHLMKEHVGIDVDAIDEPDLTKNEPVQSEQDQKPWDPENEQNQGVEDGVTHVGHKERRTAAASAMHDASEAVSEATRGAEDIGSKDIAMLPLELGLGGRMDATAGQKALEDERTTFDRQGQKEHGFASSTVPTLEERVVSENKSTAELKDASSDDGGKTSTGQLYGSPADANQNDTGPSGRAGRALSPEEQKAPLARSALRNDLTSGFDPGSAWSLPTPTPEVDPDMFEDPLCDAFWKDIWLAAAVHNTEIFRKVFHAIPDDLVTTWKQYKEFVTHHERLNKPVKEEENAEPVARMASETGDADAPGHNTIAETEDPQEETDVGDKAVVTDRPESMRTEKAENGTIPPSTSDGDAAKRRPAQGNEPFEKWEREEMGKLLEQVRGHLVVFPTRFLEGEDVANNFLFNADRILPLPIYD